MSRRAPAPPRAPAPLSQNQLEIVKKKIAGPMGPKPSGLSTFKAPKKYMDDEDEENENHGDNGENHVDGGYSKNKKFSEPNYRRETPDAWSKRDNDRDQNIGRLRSFSASEIEDADNISDLDYAEENGSGNANYARNAVNKNKARDDSTVLKRDKNYRHSRPHELDEPDEESEIAQYRDEDRNKKSQMNSPASKINNNNQQMKNTVFNFRPILHSTYRDLRSFVLSAPPAGQIVRCYIERNRTGSNILAPFYSLCADLEDGTGRELLVCRKVLRSRTPHYVFSLKSEDLWRKREQRSRLYLGKLRATTASEYVLYDSGILDAPNEPPHSIGSHDPDGDEDRDSGEEGKEEKVPRNPADLDASLYRQQMAVIVFNSKFRPVDPGVRGMEVCIPVPGTVSTRQMAEAKDASSSASAIVANPPSKASNIQGPFQKIRESGRQNDMMATKYFVLHERQSK